VGLSTRQRPYWTCRCGYRNLRAHKKCRQCETLRPPKRRPKHLEVMRGDSYPVFVKAAEEIHGIMDEACCVCGKPRPQDRHWDRDHDHRTGNPRGLACSGNQGCNIMMLPWIDSAVAYGVAAVKQKQGDPVWQRWFLIGSYLERVEVFYGEREQ